MKVFHWNEEKNQILKHERGVSFEEVLVVLSEDGPLKTLEHPNKNRYPNQKIFVLIINQYAYLVPFVETETEIFFKTIIPSRKATKQYLENK